jgi:hypothetical protein
LPSRGAAYATLAAQVYPPSLTFDLPSEEVRGYLAKIGVRRSDVMEAFNNNQNLGSDRPDRWRCSPSSRTNSTLCSLLNKRGDVEQYVLRPGNVHNAGEWRAMLAPLIALAVRPPPRLRVRFSGDEREVFQYRQSGAFGVEPPSNRRFWGRLARAGGCLPLLTANKVAIPAANR